MPCLNKVISFSRQAPIDIQCAERYIQSCPILSLRDRDLAKKDRLRASIERHFRGSIPKVTDIYSTSSDNIIYIYTIVTCALKRKSSAVVLH